MANGLEKGERRLTTPYKLARYSHLSAMAELDIRDGRLTEEQAETDGHSRVSQLLRVYNIGGSDVILVSKPDRGLLKRYETRGVKLSPLPDDFVPAGGKRKGFFVPLFTVSVPDYLKIARPESKARLDIEDGSAEWQSLREKVEAKQIFVSGS